MLRIKTLIKIHLHSLYILFLCRILLTLQNTKYKKDSDVKEEIYTRLSNDSCIIGYC